MNNIETRASQTRAENTRRTNSTNSVETAGSLAMNQLHGILFTNTYDEFSSSNPFAVDYSLYADFNGENSFDGGFLSFFSDAISILGESSFDGGFSSGFDGGFAGSDCGGSCASFTSFC